MHDTLLKGAGELVVACPCDFGCPSCVGPHYEGGPSAKLQALRMIDLLIEDSAVELWRRWVE